MAEPTFLQDMINESIANMYAGVYKLQQSGKISSSGAKKMIADSLPRINKLELIFTKDGKVQEIDYSDPETKVRIGRNWKRIKQQLKKEGIL